MRPYYMYCLSNCSKNIFLYENWSINNITILPDAAWTDTGHRTCQNDFYILSNVVHYIVQTMTGRTECWTMLITNVLFLCVFVKIPKRKPSLCSHGVTVVHLWVNNLSPYCNRPTHYSIFGICCHLIPRTESLVDNSFKSASFKTWLFAEADPGFGEKFCVKSNLTVCKVTFNCKLQKKLGSRMQ